MIPSGSGVLFGVEEGTLTQRMAELTQALAERFVAQFTEAFRLFDPTREAVDWSEFGTALLSILFVIVPTVLIFVGLRLAERPFFRRMGAWGAEDAGASWLWHRAVAIAASALSDIGVIVIAWLAGYGLALFVLGDPGTMDLRQSLFLNAFLVLESLKAAFRVLLAPRYQPLRLLPLDDEESAYWNAWLARLVDFVGYGLLLVAPIIAMDLIEGLGSLVALVVVLIGLVYAVAIIRQNRERVRDRFAAIAEASGLSFNRVALNMLARTWHVIAIAYLVALAIVIQARPEVALALMTEATVKTIVTLGIGIGLYVGISRLLGRPVRVPAATRERLPNIEERLNAFVPASLHALRFAILVLIAVGLADAWHLFDFVAWITSEGGILTLTRIITIALILLLAFGAWVAFASWIDHVLDPEIGGGDPGARKRTLLILFRSAFAIFLILMTALILLSEIGINITPLLAGAGVLGLAIGFGSQKMVQDIITGVFIQLENAIHTDDVITVAGTTGVVEKLTIRSVALRDLAGTLHIIPFSSVDTVSNFMRGFSYHVGEYGIAYREDIDEAIECLKSAFEELREDPITGANIVDDLEVSGVTGLGDSSVNIRVRIKTTPGTQWGTGRAYNRLVKRHMDAAGIEIPFPHMTLYFGAEKDGQAPPAHVRLLQEKEKEKGQEKDKVQQQEPEKGQQLGPETGDSTDE